MSSFYAAFFVGMWFFFGTNMVNAALWITGTGASSNLIHYTDNSITLAYYSFADVTFDISNKTGNLFNWIQYL